MAKLIRYLYYLSKHRWFVLVECFKVGLYWRGLIHDLSKYLPSQFFPYMEHFYSPNPAKRDTSGYYDPLNHEDITFKIAWLKHQHKSDHHWQWWILKEREIEVLPMSPDARLEMLCDWIGASKAQGNKNTKKWYVDHKDTIIIHPSTREWIERNLL